MKKRIKISTQTTLLKAGKAAAVFAIMMLAALIFRLFNLRQENTLMVFLTGILVIVIETGSYLCGFAVSILSISVFNYFFVEPYHTFYISDINNVISLTIFFIVSSFAGMLASRLQQQITLTSQLEKTKAEVEKEKSRNMLLRSISHDLRSPLTGIAGSSSFLANNYDTISKEDAAVLLQDMEKDTLSLTRMVENLLNMTRIQDGRLVIRKRKEVLDDLLSDAVSQVIKKDNTRKVILDSSSEILLVPVDGRLITQVFVNILDNAVQYTPEHTIITVRTVLSESGTDAVITVSDNGLGIAPELIEHIFETFVTGSAYADSGHGLGLGLSICKTIVDAHGGTITADNASKGGAVFTITLPLSGSSI